MHRASDQAGFALARRVITKPPAATGEAFESVSKHEFIRRRQARCFALHWTAHGFDYAISAEIETDLAAGQHVLANLSRAVLPRLQEVFSPAGIILVTAPPEILAQRLTQRNRESRAQIESRLARASFQVDPSLSPVVVENSGDLGDAVTAFIAACHAVIGTRRIK